MERSLTQFQTGCEKRLNATLARTGMTVAGRRLDGDSETYITGNIVGRDITFWIYRDGANFHAGSRRRIHTAEFRAAEKLFPDLKLAKEHLKIL